MAASISALYLCGHGSQPIRGHHLRGGDLDCTLCVVRGADGTMSRPNSIRFTGLLTAALIVGLLVWRAVQAIFRLLAGGV